MSILQLTADDVEAVMNQLKAGRTLQQVAKDLDISVEMVVCAMRKWPSINRHAVWGTF